MVACTPRAMAALVSAVLVLSLQCPRLSASPYGHAPPAATGVALRAGRSAAAAGVWDSTGDDSLHVVYLVLGAGATVVNGRFLQLDEMRDGAYQFALLQTGSSSSRDAEASSPVVMYSQLAFRDTRRLWFLGVEESNGKLREYYFVTNEPSALYPPPSGWQTQSTVGLQPSPTVTPMHGQCYANGTCVCADGYFGHYCQLRCNATLMCSGHGVCKSDMCSCDPGFTGPSCLQCGPVTEGVPPITTPRGTWVDDHCQCSSGYTGVMCADKEAPSRWMFWTWFTMGDYLVVGGGLVGLIVLCLLTCYCCNRCKYAETVDDGETRRLLSSKRRRRVSGTGGSIDAASFGGAGPSARTPVHTSGGASALHGSAGKMYGSGKGLTALHGSGSGRWGRDAGGLPPILKGSPVSPRQHDAGGSSWGAGAGHGGGGGGAGSTAPVLGFGESVRVAYTYHRSPGVAAAAGLHNASAPSPARSTSSRRRGRVRSTAHDSGGMAGGGAPGSEAASPRSPRSRRSASGSRTASTSTSRLRAAIRTPAMGAAADSGAAAGWSSGAMPSVGSSGGALHGSGSRGGGAAGGGGRMVGAHAIIASVAGTGMRDGSGPTPVRHVSGVSLHASSSTS